MSFFGVIFTEIHQIEQSQDPHASEVCLRVVTLEPDVCPLLGDPALQLLGGHQQLPQLEEQLLMLQVVCIVRLLPHILHVLVELPVARDLQQAGLHAPPKARVLLSADALLSHNVIHTLVHLTLLYQRGGP